MNSFKILTSTILLSVLTACSTYQATPTYNQSPGVRSGQVDVLYSNPTRPFKSIGIVSAKKYKPGWTDPTLSDALPQLLAAGRQLGADAVIVRSQRSNNDRHIVVEGEAIKYTD